jgi:recombination protein RecT
MTTTGNNQVAKATQQAPTAVKKIDVLKNMLNAPSVMEQFQNALAKSAPTFVASVIDLYNGDSNLQQCEPKEVVMEALKAAVLKLPINKALGYAYIIPFNNSVKITDPTGKEVWTKKMVPTFQMGYKGYIQLAMRTGQYRTINADAVYEGEIRKVNKLTGEIAFDGERKSDKTVGYFCYFELLNGFSKTIYMTVEQMANHAKRYSKGLKKDTTVEGLIALADLPMAVESKTVGWLGNFHGMALKTVIRILLSKYGYLSIEMQQAIENDYADEERDDAMRSNASANTQTFEVNDVQYEDVSGADGSQSESSEEDPGY